MRITSILLAAMFFVSGAAALHLQGAEPTQTPSGLSVSISFAPALSKPDAYSCAAEITDLATGATLAKPQITGIKGEHGQAEIGGDNSRLVLDVLVNKAGTNGTFTVTYSKYGEVVSIQKGSIAIR